MAEVCERQSTSTSILHCQIRLKRKWIHVDAVTQTKCHPKKKKKNLIFSICLSFCRIGKILLCKRLPLLCSLAFIKCTSTYSQHISQPSTSFKPFSTSFKLEKKKKGQILDSISEQINFKRHQICTESVSLAVGPLLCFEFKQMTACQLI